MSIQEVLGRIRSSPRPPNEETAKIQVIAPILRSLGWDYTDGRQVAFEHSVGGGGRDGGRVDIALKGSSSLVALIEAKAPGADLSSSVSQVLRYAFHEGTDICVLTTGLEWWFYLPWVKAPPEERRFAVLDIHRDPVEQLADDLEDFLGKRSLETGNAVEHAERALLGQRRRSGNSSVRSPDIWMPDSRGARQGVVGAHHQSGRQQLHAGQQKPPPPITPDVIPTYAHTHPPQHRPSMAHPSYPQVQGAQPSYVLAYRQPRSETAMLVLAILLPIHFFLLKRIGWGLVFWLGLLLSGIPTLIAWIVGMCCALRWTREYNQGLR